MLGYRIRFSAIQILAKTATSLDNTISEILLQLVQAKGRADQHASEGKILEAKARSLTQLIIALAAIANIEKNTPGLFADVNVQALYPPVKLE